jgi:hypothetical protein
VLVTLFGSAACKSEADVACLSAFQSAQTVVASVAGEDLDSVQEAVSALDSSLAACRAADRSGEVSELKQAHDKLSSHLARLIRRAETRAARRELSPDELARLDKLGDPDCPRGQAYVHAKSGKRIKCSGPQPVDMTWNDALAYFKHRGFKRSDTDAPASLRFVYGAQTIVISYDKPNSEQPPVCVVLYPAPDTSWQEATARLTGVSPGRLKSGRALQSGRGKLALWVVDQPDKVIVRIGRCE